MRRRLAAALRRVGPWLALIVLAVELVFVWSGWLSLGTAVAVAVGLELLLWLVLLGRTVAAVRRYRRSRSTGGDVWAAAEDAVAELVPRRLARWLVLEPRMWWSLARWLGRRHRRDTGGFAYHRERTVLMGALIVLAGFECVVLHVVLLATVGSTWWVWLIGAVDVYAVLWLTGLYASLVVLPHRIEAGELRLRYGFLDDLRVAVEGIRAVRRVRVAERGRRLRPDPRTGAAMFSCGDATVALDLADGVVLYRNRSGLREPVRTLYVTADDPGAFAAALRAAASTQY